MSEARHPYGAAIAGVVADPGLWLLGAAGFLVRGGFLLLALPIWTLPGVIEITTIVGPDAIGPGGLAGRGTVLALVAAGGALAILFAALVAGAAIETAAWDRLARGEAAEVLDADVGLPAGRAARVGLVLDLAGVGLACLVPALLAAAVAVVAIVQAIYAEIIVPGSLAIPLPVRIATRAAPALALVAAGLVVGELLHGVASRRVLRGAASSRGLTGRPVLAAIAEVVRRPASVLFAAAAGWVVAAAAALLALASILICWSFVRAAYVDAAPLDGGDAPGLLAATAVFVAVWLAALLLCGVASAIRAALWSARLPQVSRRAADAASAPAERSRAVAGEAD